MKKLLLLLLGLLPALPSLAYYFQVDGIYYTTHGAGTCSVTDGDQKYSGKVTIPSSVTYNGTTYSVTKIGDRAFESCSGLTSVTYLATEPIQEDSDLFESKVYENATLNYLKSAESKIAITEPWCLFKNRIGRDANFVDSITEVHGSDNETTAVYDMRGVRIGDSLEGLPHGVYIIRQGSKTTKHAI